MDKQHFVINKQVGLISLLAFIVTICGIIFQFSSTYFNIAQNTKDIENNEIKVSKDLLEFKRSNYTMNKKIDLMTNNIYLMMGKLGVEPIRMRAEIDIENNKIALYNDHKMK